MEKDRLIKAFMELYELVARLRSPGGCPWDARQTYRTVRMYLLEEAYETLDAIERGDVREICRELGDLLFEVIFLAYIGEEKGEFDLIQVLTEIHEKMVRRHPHVFGSSKVASAEEVSLNWASIKEIERKENGRPALPFDTIPGALPSLLRAHRLGERAAKAGLLKLDRTRLWTGIKEGLGSLEGLDREKDQEFIREKMGTLLFDLANLARDLGFNAEDLLRFANQKFYERTRMGSKDEADV